MSMKLLARVIYSNLVLLIAGTCIPWEIIKYIEIASIHSKIIITSFIQVSVAVYYPMDLYPAILEDIQHMDMVRITPQFILSQSGI